ncbi:MAG: HlyD family efflux transporter periplasmic adaptor subunit [Planctomycetia bacterium]|nr:HlyD family efflux transporter periplasmic adaptor subunit [Planctomycetia bacterium]
MNQIAELRIDLMLYRLLTTCLLMTLLVSCPARAADPPAEAAQTVLTGCFVMLIEEADVPAQDAGVLAELKVHEGADVRAGELLAQLNDRRAEIDKRLAQFEYKGAREKAENDINVRYAKSAADVAEAEYQASIDANQRVPNSVSQSDIRKLKLEHRRAILQIEQSQLDQQVSKSAAEAAGAKVEAADDGLRRRRIESPIDGTVVEIHRHQGEWVQSGEALVHVVRLDRLRVEGFVKASQFAPSQIRGRKVTVVAELAGGRHREFTGRVVFINPLLQSGGDFRVWAEVDNRQEDGQWILQPGQPVTMKVQ